MKRISPRLTELAVRLARQSVSCDSCFAQLPLLHAGISSPQPFVVGTSYRAGGVAVVGINPGASMDGGYKESRKQALDRFVAGDHGSLKDNWDALAYDAENYWNPRYLARLPSLHLGLSSLLIGNIALCATAGNKYPQRMRRNCWSLHSASALESYAPGSLILLGSSGVMDEFVYLASKVLPTARVLRIAHYAHREGMATKLLSVSAFAMRWASRRQPLAANPSFDQGRAAWSQRF